MNSYFPPPQETKPFFSIIVPVFNTEKYITQCLQSCINQSFSEIEIIVIDDCGSDGAIAIAEEYAKEDSRIKIIHNPHNLGLFHTRIVGESEAKGKFVIHLDSDDFIEEQMCSLLYQALQQNRDTDLIFFGAIFNFKNKQEFSFICDKDQYFTNEILHLLGKRVWAIWHKAYRKDFLIELHQEIQKYLPNLPKINMAEDALKTFWIYLYAKKAIAIPYFLYHYRLNPSSLTHSPIRIKQMQKDHQAIIEALNDIALSPQAQNHPFFKEQKEDYQARLSSFTYATKQALLNQPKNYIVEQLHIFQYNKSWKVIAKILLHILSFGKFKK